MYKISVVVPALNEEANIRLAIENIVDAFSRLGVDGEIIAIDDGSQDRTSDYITEYTKKYNFISHIKHSKPHGVGASFWEGVQEARGEIVTMLPGDAENDAIEILRYLPLMDHVDIIVPFVFNTQKRSWKRRMLSKTYKAIINLSFGFLLNYMNGTVMYRRSILKSLVLETGGFFYQTELLIKCIRQGYLYAEVPYAIRTRESGGSKALTIKSFFTVLKGYFSTLRAVYFQRHNQSLEPAHASLTCKRWQEVT